jgi:methanethiol S-methyltransferase
MSSTLLIVLLMIVFAAVHSFLAGANIKSAIRRRFGQRVVHGLYRLAYNVIAVITLAPAVFIAFAQPGRVFWQFEGTAAVIALIVQIGGFIGLVISLIAIDLGQFTGLSQLRAYINGQPLPLPTEPLQIKGAYALVRHPLYLFSLMFLWAAQTMTEAYFVLTIAATLYFTLGSLLEERRMVRLFGQPYIDYRKQVAWLIPFVRFKSTNS